MSQQMNDMIYGAMQKADSQRISYIPWDFNYHAKQRSSFILADMASVINTGLDATSFFFICPADDCDAHQVHCCTVVAQHVPDLWCLRSAGGRNFEQLALECMQHGQLSGL